MSFTDPSRLFSIGTTPSPAIPVSTAEATAETLGKGMRWAWESYFRAACSVLVPGGPRYAMLFLLMFSYR